MRNRKQSFRVGLGILVSLLALAVLIWFVDLTKVFQALKRMNYLYLVPVLILSLVSFGTRAAGWKTILPGDLSLGKVFLIVHAGYFLNTIFPFRLGEVGRALLLKPSGLDFWEAIPTILLERVFDLIFALSLFLGALPFIFNVPQGSRYALLVGALVGTGLVLLYLLVRYQQPLLSWVERRDFLGLRIKSWVQEKLRSFLRGLAILSNPVRFIQAFLWMAISWGLALGYQYLLLRAFTPQAEVLWAAFALGAVALGVSIPASPGNIGVYEASLVAALLVFGMDQSLAFAYALVSHLLSLAITTILGSYTVVHEGFEIGTLFEAGTSTNKGGK